MTMTKEDKELLVKDLCARWMYGVIVETYWEFENKKEKTFPKTTLTHGMIAYYIGEEKWKYNTHFLPYLRPMSSMTEEEKKELQEIAVALSYNKDDIIIGTQINSFRQLDGVLDLFNSHHLDWRGLIEKGLALEAPKDMYNLNNK